MNFLVLTTGIGRLAGKAPAAWNPVGWVKSLPMWVSAPVGVVALMTFGILCVRMIAARRKDKDRNTIVRACRWALLAVAIAGVWLVSVLS
ncbi:hypothetical protein [Actinoallomurus sp. NPDC052274]|uniref:hypothetical protein n=1 Tax=Actinoallomurus sp. NPDC052274 TaxID=3155420 RepID=UPI00341F01F8